MKPLDRLSSIKAKLGTVIVAAVAVTVAVVTFGAEVGVHPLLSAVAAGGLALGMVQFLARGMTSPLRQMARASERMASGDYARRVSATSRDEVGELARAFNAMASDLAEVDRQRRDLIANVSHELRTPLSALRANLENVIDGVEPPRAETLETMLKQVERLGDLVAQLLDLSRLESGTLPFAPARLAVRPVLEEAVAAVRAHTDRHRVTVAVDPDEITVDGDADRLHQVISNLVENAIRHSPPDGAIDVRAHRRDGSVVIEVADEGPGIAPHEVDRVFERFYRADTARRDDGGAGLGLSIARWIVELHGGAIRVEPGEPAGCRMVVEIPASRP